MRVVVTGAAGFIGSHLVDSLLAEGDEVVGVDCFLANYPREDKLRNLEGALADDRFEFVEADLRVTDLSAILDGAEGLVHLAALTNARAPRSQQALFEELNVSVPRALLASARDAKLESILLAGSSSVYGGARPDGAPSSERDPLSPIAPYGESKAAMEGVAEGAAELGAPVRTLRFFTCFGSRQRPDMLAARTIAAALGGPPLPLFGDGSQRRAFVHVSDVVSATVAALKAELEPGEVINVGSPVSHSVEELIAAVGEICEAGVAVDRRPADPADPTATVADISKARRLLGWEPETSLAEGLAEQATWAGVSHERR